MRWRGSDPPPDRVSLKRPPPASHKLASHASARPPAFPRESLGVGADPVEIYTKLLGARTGI